MNFFEQELRKIVKGCEAIHYPKYVGRECIARLTDDLTVKLSFRTLHIVDHYDALQIRLMNRRDGEVDSQHIRFADVWGQVTMQGRDERISPYAWTYQEDTHWYGFRPNEMQYQQISDALNDYLGCFLAISEEETMDMNL